jgi:putative sterol carrier protein
MYKYGTDEWNENYAKLVEKRTESEPKPYIVGTPEWISAFEKAVQGDDRYKKVAKNWEGSVILVFKAHPPAGLDEDLFVFQDLWHGDCRYARVVPADIGRAGDYVLEADYERWKKILKKELNVVKEIATRKIQLVPFNFKKAAKLAAAAQAALRLVDLAGDIGARFPDDLEPEAFESYKALLKELKTDFGI